MKNCELCKVPARTFCESDQASLCWECDAKVHGANFLVSRHSRTLLCHSCQSATPWKASGPKLGNTSSVCESCAGGGVGGSDQQGDQSESGNDDEIDLQDDLNEQGYDDEGDEDGDNQVVPWSSTPPPPAASSSISEDSISMFINGNRDISETVSISSLKRLRDNVSDLLFQSGGSPANGEATSIELLRPLKDRKTGSDGTYMLVSGFGSSSTNGLVQIIEGQEIRNPDEKPEEVI
ncbi:Zinc finger, B-box [Quillaja saponaria]|uniref:Zinc finger, B-box n=1 Tax=Quillaja saponaria TaxID=32244 RepID=A0AAD7VN12_QUISA|nr:Zinc finger, B-box [Quillaja saponaria]